MLQKQFLRAAVFGSLLGAVPVVSAVSPQVSYTLSAKSVVTSSQTIEFTSNELVYHVIDEANNTVEVAGYMKDLVTVSISIPETTKFEGTEYTVSQIGSLAFSDIESCDTILIPGSIKTIKSRAFSGANIRDIVFLNSSLTLELESGAFSNLQMKGGGTFTIPAGTKIIPDSCFFNSSIGQIVIPESIENIGERAFALCKETGNIRCYAVEPPLTAQSAFEDSWIREVYVPVGSESAYKAAPGWDILKSAVNSGFPVKEGNLYYLLSDSDDAPSARIAPHPQLGGAMRYSYTNIDSIPSSITSDNKEYTVTGLTAGALRMASDAITLLIPPSITYIGSGVILDSSYSKIIFDEYQDNEEELTLAPYAFMGTRLEHLSLPKRIQFLPEGLFLNSFYIKTVELPAVSYLEKEIFFGCESMTSLTVKAEVPPTATEESFDPANFVSCTLYVPEESVEAYATAEGWKLFERILPISSALSDAATDGCVAVRGEVYGTDGSLLRCIERPEGGLTAGECCSGLPAGIYPVRLTDASGRTTTIKVAAK